MEIKDRIKMYLDLKGIRIAPFEKEVGLSNGYWRKTKSISAKCVEDILRTYPDISAEWLMRGEGEMFKSSKPSESIYNINNVQAKDSNVLTGDENITDSSGISDTTLKMLIEQQNKLIALYENKK